MRYPACCCFQGCVHVAMMSGHLLQLSGPIFSIVPGDCPVNVLMLTTSPQMMSAIAGASDAGKLALKPCLGLLRSREPIWRDLKRSGEASDLAYILQTHKGPEIEVPLVW